MKSVLPTLKHMATRLDGMPLATAIDLGEEMKLYRVLGVKDEVAGVGSGLLYRGYPHNHFKRQGRKRRQTCSDQGFLVGA